MTGLPASSVRYASLSRRLYHLLEDNDFLDNEVIYYPTNIFSSPAAIVSWGQKKWSPLAARVALNKNIQHIRLEDGFLRSFGLGVNGKRPLSIVVDGPGIHYDPMQPSRIESILESADLADSVLFDRARSGICSMKDGRLSKYNLWQKPIEKLAKLLEEPYILIVDQVKDDASVKASGYSEQMAKRLLDTAQKENPGVRLIFKTHPDVTSGKKKGCFDNLLPKETIVVDQTIDPWYLLEKQPVVYTISSLLGLEALIAGCKIRCFGGPFYAGWGLTDDEMTFDRRNRRLSLEELFAGAYLLYPKYIDPFTGERTEFEQVANIIANWKRSFYHRKPNAVCVGISKWKQPRIRKILEFGNVHVQYNNSPGQIFKQYKRGDTEVFCWPSKTPKELTSAKNAGQLEITSIEDGFIRSKGLGAELTLPNSLVFDSSGIYFDPTAPSDLENLLQSGTFDQALKNRADKLIALINKTRISKYNVGDRSNNLDLPDKKKIILVPGQVEDDASIQLGTEDICNNLQLLKHVRATNPDAFIIYKPHPDVEAGLRIGEIKVEEASHYADHIASQISSQSLLDQVDEVHTMTSTLGFEALCQGTKVTTYGRPFYGGWGLTTDHLNFSRRTRKLELNELVAGVLIHYPVYFDPLTEQLCTPELLIERLSSDGDNNDSVYIQCRKILMRIWRRFYLR